MADDAGRAALGAGALSCADVPVHERRGHHDEDQRYGRDDAAETQA